MHKKIKFVNNVRLVLTPLKETQTATLLVLIGVGSRHEGADNNGVSHFIEHMMFKGTKKRPDTLALSKELDRVGAEFNAFTGKDYTGYYVKSDSSHLDLSINVLSDMLLNSKFDRQEIKREKGVIIEEINMYEDNPLMFVDDLLEQSMYDNNPLGMSISGDRKSVTGLDRKKLINYRNKFYQGSNIVIGLSGNYNLQQVKSIKSKFKFSNSDLVKNHKKINISQTSARVNLKYKNTEQVQLALGFPAYSYFNDKINALQLLSTILGGNMSSRLFLSVRERKGLAYFVRSWVSTYEDTGGLIIQAGLDKMRVESAIRLILTELKKIKTGVKLEELNRAKDHLAGKLILNLEDSANLCQWYSQQELLTGKILTPKQKITKIMNVSLKQITAVARDIIDFGRLNLALIGPFRDKNKFVKLIK